MSQGYSEDYKGKKSPVKKVLKYTIIFSLSVCYSIEFINNYVFIKFYQIKDDRKQIGPKRLPIVLAKHDGSVERIQEPEKCHSQPTILIKPRDTENRSLSPTQKCSPQIM